MIPLSYALRRRTMDQDAPSATYTLSTIESLTMLELSPNGTTSTWYYGDSFVFDPASGMFHLVDPLSFTLTVSNRIDVAPVFETADKYVARSSPSADTIYFVHAGFYADVRHTSFLISQGYVILEGLFDVYSVQ